MDHPAPPAATALRILSPVQSVLGEEDSLQSIDTTILPDGCLAYVIAVNTAYRLHKDLVPPINGVVAPSAGPGGWVPEAGSAIFVNNVSFPNGTPGTINAQSTVSATGAPDIPLLATDIVSWFGTNAKDNVFPTNVTTLALLSNTGTPPDVTINFMNIGSGGTAVPDGLLYYFLVYRPLR